MRKFWRGALLLIPAVLFFYSFSWAGNWEKRGEYYYLSKDSRDNFSLPGAGPNIFPAKYLKYNGVDFLVRGAEGWQDYGRLDLEYSHIFSLPIRSGIKISQLHLLIGGNYSNSYEHDSLMRLYGDKYFYATLIVIFIYDDGGYRELAVPVFWDWFHIGPGSWSGNGAEIRSLGENPVRKDCSIFHVVFNNPRPLEPVKNILISDSWLGDRPFSDVFALTIKSADDMDASPRTEK
ncbi:MAG: hypothetical protein PHQ84_01790 [Candidatus Omnitrophica bacterium]|nr:hypothetical protein [Candidatus Omnitrophota bacterium]